MIDGNMKLIVPDSHNRPKDIIELYDFTADPLEEHNIAASRTEKVKTMHDSLDARWPGQ